ncbi:MAG: hypothetical protein M1819_000498 [Sarea resinae]|nr:MAG: hypothetical protein M1819_000498 [Sarea resinae]
MASNTAAFDLGPLYRGPWQQYTNKIGQVYYQNTANRAVQYAIPRGWEDAATDKWTRDASKTWPQWNNDRTGRAVLIDPNPPPPQTYLDDPVIRAHILSLQRAPESDEHLYRVPTTEVICMLFPRQEGYSVVETGVQTSLPVITVLEVFRRPGGTLHNYEHLIVECRKMGCTVAAAEPELHDALATCNHESKNIYGLIQCGFRLQFYKHENFTFGRIGPTMHLVDDAKKVMEMLEHLKANPLPGI